jgi:hypothetical protein
VSAFERHRRGGGLNDGHAREARDNLNILQTSWSEIYPNERLRESAERLIAVHPLRAADALQLAAALQWCQRATKDAALVTFDIRLREVAEREGFRVEPLASR